MFQITAYTPVTPIAPVSAVEARPSQIEAISDSRETQDTVTFSEEAQAASDITKLSGSKVFNSAEASQQQEEKIAAEENSENEKVQEENIQREENSNASSVLFQRSLLYSNPDNAQKTGTLLNLVS